MKTKFKQLSEVFQPQLLTLKLNIDQNVIDRAYKELTQHAKGDKNKCFGYFPGMRKDDISHDLPACKNFAVKLPQLIIEGRQFDFNFMRLSLIKQEGTSPYHLDTDAATALTGDIETLGDRLVWRLLINMHEHSSRTLGYLNVDPTSTLLDDDGSYVHCVDQEAEKQSARSISIPPRQGTAVHGVLFCASRVLHTGKDDNDGHFVMGYGCEEPA